MVDLNQRIRLMMGVGEWNAWRQRNEDVSIDLSGAHLRLADLSGAHLNLADLTGADLIGAHLEGAYLTGAHLRGAYLRLAHLTGADLRLAYLTEADLTRADLTGAHLRLAHLAGAHLTGAHLTRADLRGADLTRADLTRADLTGAHLTGAHLTGADLTRADLTGAHLEGADLTGADLTGAHLTGAHLTGAHLTGADLNKTILTHAHGLPASSKITPLQTQSASSPPSIDWSSIIAVAGLSVLPIVANFGSVIQALDVVERRWREHNEKQSRSPATQVAPSPAPKGSATRQEIVEICLIMDDGSRHGFQRWVDDPDTLRAYIDAFTKPSSKVKPYFVIVKKQKECMRIDITDGGKDNEQLNEILKYIDANPA